MSPAEIIINILENEGIGTYGGVNDWSLYYSKEPNQPNNVITVYNAGSLLNPVLLFDGTRINYYSVNIRVRGISTTLSWNKAEEINALLKNRDLSMYPGAVGLLKINGPQHIGFDDSNKSIHSMNYQLTKED